MTYSTLLVTKENRCALIQFNRPEVLNALNMKLMEELVAALEQLDGDPDVNLIILTGNEKAFAAGADVKEMAGAGPVDMVLGDQFARWDRIRKIKKPIMPAVSAFPLGGGCELPLSCDMIIASESAKFGQPEINIGVIPGAGGTQRLVRAVGKALAMEMILNNRSLTAQEALQYGLVNRVVPVADYLNEALTLAEEIASRAPLA